MVEFKEQYQHLRSGPETVSQDKPRQVVFHNSPEAVALVNYPLAVKLYGAKNTAKIIDRLNKEYNFNGHLLKRLIALKQTEVYKDNFLLWGNKQAAAFLRITLNKFNQYKRRGWIRNEAFSMQNIYRPQTLINGLLKNLTL